MSWNSLFEQGGNPTGVALDADWTMLDNAPSTVVEDNSVNNFDGTLFGGPNTEGISVTGPNSYLARGLSFGGADGDRVETGLVTPNAAAGTCVLWFRPDNAFNSSAVDYLIGQFEDATPDREFSFQHFSDNNLYIGWRGPGGDTRIVLSASSSNWIQAQWQQYVLTWEDGGDTVLYHDGSQIGLQSGTSTHEFTALEIQLADSPVLSRQFLGDLGQIAFFDRVLDSTELAEIFPTGEHGPEPVNVTPASAPTGETTVGSTLTGSTDDVTPVLQWGLAAPFTGLSNGAISVSTVEWWMADDASGLNKSKIAGSEGSNALLLGEALVGKHLATLRRGENDGGFDSQQDTLSAWTGAVASEPATALRRRRAVEAQDNLRRRAVEAQDNLRRRAVEAVN